MENFTLEKICKKLRAKFGRGMENNSMFSYSDEIHPYGFREERRWSISFMGNEILTSSSSDEKFIQPFDNNEKLIEMLATGNTVLELDKFVSMIAFSGFSDKNKEKWIEILQKGLSDAE